MITRRTAAGSILAGTLMAGAAQGQPRPLRVRKDLATLNDNADDILALKAAMRRMGGAGPLSWRAQVELHARHDLQHHTSWRFLPWHRLQLVYFERIVSKLSGKADFALPYWNWQDNDVLPNQVGASPLLDPTRTARAGERVQDWMDRFGYAYRPTAGMSIADMIGTASTPGIVSHSGHDLIHMFVGGHMGDITSAVYDPIFWFHHANVDRIWWAQARRYPETSDLGAYPEGWAQADLRGYIDENGREVAPTACGATRNTEALGYTYDSRGPVVVAAAPQPVPGSAEPRGGAAPPPAAPPPPPPPRPQLPADLPRRIETLLKLERTGPGAGRITIPAQLMAHFSALANPRVTITSQAQVISNGHQLVIAANTAGTTEPIWSEQAFALPMGDMGAMPWNHRFDLSQDIARAGDQAGGGFVIDVAARRLAHLAEGALPDPQLESFEVRWYSEI